MANKEALYIFTDNQDVEKIAVSQSYGTDIPSTHHKGHIIIYFSGRVDAEGLAQKIGILPGIHRTETFNQNSGIMISIDDTGDAFPLTKEIGQLLLQERLITQDEIAALYRTLDDKTAMAASAERKKERSRP